MRARDQDEVGISPPGADKPPIPDGPTRNGIVTVRLAGGDDDILAMTTLGRRMMEETPFYDRFPYRYDPVERQQAWLARWKEHPGQHGFFMAELDGGLIGLMIVQIGAHLHLPIPVAQVVTFYVAPEHRGGLAAIKLAHACRKWAKDKGAAILHFNVTTGVRAATTDRFLRKLGFRQTGGNYEMIMDAGQIEAAAARTWESDEGAGDDV